MLPKPLVTRLTGAAVFFVLLFLANDYYFSQQLGLDMILIITFIAFLSTIISFFICHLF